MADILAVELADMNLDLPSLLYSYGRHEELGISMSRARGFLSRTSGTYGRRREWRECVDRFNYAAKMYRDGGIDVKEIKL